MRRILSFTLVLAMLALCFTTVFAADTSREYFFELSVDGSATKQVQPGDVITVVFTLYRTDSEDSSIMYAMQNEIRYDSDFFRLVEGSALLSSGITTTEIGRSDAYREFYMNFVSLTGGESWPAQRLVGSFQLEVIAESGVSKITNQDYLVSTADGKDSYTSTCQDVTIIVSTDCLVTFESNGGTDVPSQTVHYGELVERPDNPTRDGYTFGGWYSDIDLQDPWDFETDTVQGNMTLYAKWQKGEAIIGDPDAEGGFGGLWWLLGLGLLGLILLILILFMSKKTVKFETDCNTQIKDQKIKKGGLIARPEEPSRVGRTFAGWYSDEARTMRWDFENDKVEENMTLYAKWI